MKKDVLYYSKLFGEHEDYIYDNKSERIKKLQFIILIIAYLVIAFIQSLTVKEGQYANIISGVIAQIQVFISVVLVARYNKKGYIATVVLNGLLACRVALTVFMGKNITAAPGIVVPLCTIITMYVLYITVNRLSVALQKLEENKEELLALVEEAEDAYEKVRMMNIELANRK